MGVIVVNNLGGMYPSVLPRALPDNAAQVASNLLARTAEFRPLAIDTTVATSSVGSPKTLYRMARDANKAFTSNMALNWKANADALNYVKGQVNDETTERTYYTYDDGSQPPRVFSLDLPDGKPLGVPAPATKPTGIPKANYSFSPEQRTAELVIAQKAVADAVRKSVTLSWLGVRFGTATSPGNTTAGYHDLIDANVYNPDHAKTFRVFQVDRTTGKVTDTFSSLSADMVSPVLADSTKGIAYDPRVYDPRLGGFFMKVEGAYASTWIATGADVYVVPFYVYGRTYGFTLAGRAAATALMAGIKMPGTGITVGGEVVTQQYLLTTPQITKLLGLAEARYGVTSARIKPLVEALHACAFQFHTILDSGRISSVDFVVAKQVELKALSDAIGAEYDLISTELEAAAAEFYYSENIDATVPQGIARIIEDRFYVCTYVTDWGEESAPSPVSDLFEVDENDTVTGGPPNPPAGYGITKFRAYRTNTGNTGAAFQFVGEVDFVAGSTAQVSVEDTKKATELGEVCPTTTWLTPPQRMKKNPAYVKGGTVPELIPDTTSNPYMRGLVGMPNGIMVGFYDNTVCPSESYVPYAYPVEYQVTTEYPIVGLGVFGQTCVVLTQGNPYFCTGSDAASLSLQKMETPQACVSAASIAASDGGVIYASPDGLCMASSQGVQLITENHFTHEDWQELNPSTIIGAIHELTYYFMYGTGTGQKCYALHMGTGKLISVDVQGSAFFTDILTDRLYVAKANDIIALFNGSAYRTGVWRSKIAVLQAQAGFAWLGIESDFKVNDVLTPISVRWYGDGALIYTATVTSRTPVRLPAGRYLEHEIEISTTARWNKLTFASSTAELQKV